MRVLCRFDLSPDDVEVLIKDKVIHTWNSLNTNPNLKLERVKVIGFDATSGALVELLYDETTPRPIPKSKDQLETTF